MTIYYTIRESGCTASSRTTSLASVRIGATGRIASVSGLNKGFVDAVKLEGCGRLKAEFTDSVTGDTYPYLSYDYATDEWTYRKFPVGNRENRLYKGYCAASVDDLNQGSRIQLLLSNAITQAFGGNVFEMADVGENIRYHHIDLYWGEDDPLRGDPSSGIPNGLNCSLPKGRVIRGILLKE